MLLRCLSRFLTVNNINTPLIYSRFQRSVLPKSTSPVFALSVSLFGLGLPRDLRYRFHQSDAHNNTNTSPDTKLVLINEMELKNVVNKLNEFASLSLAESWDNVGLLVEPSPPHTVKKMILTNDLTAPVLEEAVQTGVDLILSYHPPIFSPLKQLTQRSWKEKLLVRCIEKRIAVYSPHTCYDALKGGVNDWLIGAFDMKSVKPVEQSETSGGELCCQVDVVIDVEDVAQLVASLKDKSIPRRITTTAVTLHESSPRELTQVSVACGKGDTSRVMDIAQSRSDVVSVEKRNIGKIPLVGYGMGRVGKLTAPLTLTEAVTLVKKHLGLEHIRVAAALETARITSVAVCAGSGSAVLRGAKADLIVTGEMSHHDVLNSVCKGTSVILCEHSNTERGYLAVLKVKLASLLSDQVEITLSKTDTDPLKVV